MESTDVKTKETALNKENFLTLVKTESIPWSPRTAGMNNSSKLSAKQYKEGFTGLALNSEKFDAQWMQDSGRNLAVVNPAAPFKAPEQFNVNASKERKRYQKKVMNIWNSIIPNGNDLYYQNGPYSIQSNVSENIPRICREQSRQEYYLPFAFKYNNMPVGGSYVHVWEAGTPKQIQKPRETVSQKPFTEFFTGGCLFGVALYGVDQFGKKHSLTNPGNEIPESSVIQSIYSPHEIHPDEILTRESLVNIIHMIKTLGSENTVLKYHLPFSNYIIYGLNWFLKGNMTSQSLADYIETVRERVESQKSYLESVASNFSVNIKVCTSLDDLELDKFNSNSILCDLPQKLQMNLNISDSLSRDELSNVRIKLFDAIVDFMKSQTDEIGEVWTYIEEKINDNTINTYDHNLLMLNYLDYSASLAVSSMMNEERNAASILPSHESPINHLYKKIFSEKFGAVTCFQWLSPLQVHDSDIGPRAAHISEHINDINDLLKLGLIRKSFIQTAAAALNSEELQKQISEEIDEILEVHEQEIALRNRKERLMKESHGSDLFYLKVDVYAS